MIIRCRVERQPLCERCFCSPSQYVLPEFRRPIIEGTAPAAVAQALTTVGGAVCGSPVSIRSPWPRSTSRSRVRALVSAIMLGCTRNEMKSNP